MTRLARPAVPIFVLLLSSCGGGGSGGGGQEPAAGDAAGLAGRPCDYYCTGHHCNLRCEDDVIYYCPSSERWILEEDCLASGRVCRTVHDEEDRPMSLECAPPSP